MILYFILGKIAILGVLSIHLAHAQTLVESIAIILTAGQLVSSVELAEPLTDGRRTNLELNIPQVIRTEISLVTIVQVSTTTIKEVVRVTETLRETCVAAQSSAEGPFTNLAGAASSLSVTPTSTRSALGSIISYSSSTGAKKGSSSKELPNTDFQPSASASRPCNCQCLCPTSSFPIFKTKTASPVSVISTFQTLPSFVTPGQSISLTAPSQPSPADPAKTASNIPFDIKTFSLLDEVTVPITV